MKKRDINPVSRLALGATRLVLTAGLLWSAPASAATLWLAGGGGGGAGFFGGYPGDVGQGATSGSNGLGSDGGGGAGGVNGGGGAGGFGDGGNGNGGGGGGWLGNGGRGDGSTIYENGGAGLGGFGPPTFAGGLGGQVGGGMANGGYGGGGGGGWSGGGGGGGYSGGGGGSGVTAGGGGGGSYVSSAFTYSIFRPGYWGTPNGAGRAGLDGYFAIYTWDNDYSTTFDYTGGLQTYVTPVSDYYNMVAVGAQGGSGGASGDIGGYGGEAIGLLVWLNAGATLDIVVGGAGMTGDFYDTSGGPWAGGGGGGTFVYAAAPEPATWAMMLIGFAGLGFAGYRRTRKPGDSST